MSFWQHGIILAYGILHLIVFIKGWYEVVRKRNPYGLTNSLTFVGIFVWGDSLILGPFWVGITCLVLILQSWYLFLFILSLFWVVRSFGEVLYWLLEQFAEKKRNPPHTLRFHNILRGEAVWFIYQLIWQCVLILSLVASLYTAKLWISS